MLATKDPKAETERGVEEEEGQDESEEQVTQQQSTKSAFAMVSNNFRGVWECSTQVWLEHDKKSGKQKGGCWSSIVELIILSPLPHLPLHYILS